MMQRRLYGKLMNLDFYVVLNSTPATSGSGISTTLYSSGQVEVNKMKISTLEK